MGKATRWLKGIFGIKSNGKVGENELGKCYSGDRKRSGFGNSGGLCTNPATITPNMTSPESSWVKSSYYAESDKEQSKHAIAVAAATAAAADAAVAAAQAAVAVVRLTSHGRGKMFPIGGGGGGTERWAAVKVQTTFRGYLARKALRALKGLVKIQALVRGFLVRKQATATLHGMQALIRAQATVRSKRAQPRNSGHDFYSYPKSDIRARRSLEIFDDSRSEQAASVHSRRLSASFESRSMNPITEDIPKIVEVDPGRPRTPSRQWKNNNTPGPGPDPYDRDPSYPPRISIPICHHSHESEYWGLSGDECRFSTAHSTPRYLNSGGPNPGPVTPSRSVCGDSTTYNNYLRHQYGNGHGNGNYYQHPNYMSNTQSFRAKVRSQSAPKQRPEEGQSRKRLSLNEMMESRNSLSGVRMQRSCSQVQEAVNFKNAVMGKLERSSHDFGREPYYYHLPRKY